MKLFIPSTFVLLLLFSCKEKPEKPVVSTISVTEITTISAVSGGVISDDGGEPVLLKGICWKTATEPTIDDHKTTATGETNTFSGNMTELSPKTKYYVRAYATNSVGTSYGESISFITLGDSPAPVSSAATGIDTVKATLNGSVNPNDLSTTVIFEWGTTTSYDNTIASSNNNISGHSSVNVSANLTGLTPGTVYHFRVKAENSLGTTFSADMTFTTLGDKPAVTLVGASGITLTNASLTSSVNPNYLATSVTFEWGTTTDYNNTTTGQDIGNGNFVVDVIQGLSGLLPATTYHYRVKAINLLGTVYSEDLTFTTYALVDAEHNFYHSVNIGSQTWMKENLKTSKFNDNTDIQLITDNTAWSNMATPAYSWYDNDGTMNKNSYGALYNWFAVETGKLCPSGWHVPDKTDWTTLINYLGGTTIAGGKLKETNQTHWQAPNTGATDESGFTGLPGGNRDLLGPFYNLGQRGYWWTKISESSTNAWYMHMAYDTSDAILIDYGKTMGFSVRCIKD